jgi:hypothetical protein
MKQRWDRVTPAEREKFKAEWKKQVRTSLGKHARSRK